MADETNYVTRAGWLNETGRPDLVDEIADQFERSAPEVAAADTAWPRRSQGWHGWHARTGWHPHPKEQRVAG